MKIIDLSNKSNSLVDKHINEYCGGKILENKWISLINRGVGGMTFFDINGGEETKEFKVNIGFFKQGIGLYFQKAFTNKLVLLKLEEIKSVEVVKEADILRPYSFSIFSLLSKAGLKHSTASSYLIPKEIIKEDKAKCIIMIEDQFFELILDKITPEKLSSVFKKSNLGHLLRVQVASPKIKVR
ncbi:MAG: hypothetical protein IPL55_18675 [Saprospiraceae bacterium]|nr:hypothetical protein [Saprospiraceae bacterium]MBL0025478.1 hypothetical protein [Saprospiraceae bacterium]